MDMAIDVSRTDQLISRMIIIYQASSAETERTKEEQKTDGGRGAATKSVIRMDCIFINKLIIFNSKYFTSNK